MNTPFRLSRRTLAKSGQNLSQLHLNERKYAVNCKYDGEKGSAISHFLGRAIRTSIPNSWTRQIDWQKQIELQGEDIEGFKRSRELSEENSHLKKVKKSWFRI